MSRANFLAFMANEENRKLTKTAALCLFLAEVWNATLDPVTNTIQVHTSPGCGGTYNIACSIMQQSYVDSLHNKTKGIAYWQFGFPRCAVSEFNSITGYKYGYTDKATALAHNIAMINKEGSAAFIKAKLAGLHILHLDTASPRNSLNNQHTNLRYGTAKENVASGTRRAKSNTMAACSFNFHKKLSNLSDVQAVRAMENDVITVKKALGIS